MTPLDGLFTGFVIGLVLSAPAVVSELIRHGRNLPLLMDVRTFWGRKLDPHHVLLWSVVTHLANSAIFGAAAPLLVRAGVFSPLYLLPEILIYGAAFYLIASVIVFPILGFGFFGHKEGEWVWLELLLAHLLYAVLYWGAAQLFFV